jgi:hypothetical protein
MDISNVSTQNSLETFNRLVMNARLRNGGFDLPVKRAEVNKTAAYDNSVRTDYTAKTVKSQVLGGISGKQPESRILGTHFDAYA